MEPIGTITNYYPFLDEESISIVDSLMKAASNYISFVDDLVDIVCSDDPTSALRYLALIHSVDTERTRNRENLIKIRNTYEDDIVVKALTFWSIKSSLTEEAVSDFFRVTEDALSTHLDQWVAVVLLLNTGNVSSPRYPEVSKYLDQAKTMIECNDELEFYKGYLHLIQGIVLRQEGNIDGAEREFERGIAVSKKYSHLYLEFHLLESHANYLKDKDTHASLVELETAYKLGKELGDKELSNSVLHSMGLVYTTLGEYDLALQAHLESVEGIKTDSGVATSLVLARLLCDLGRGEEALEWIQWGESATGVGWISIMWHLVKALSLIRLDRIEEADSILDATREMAFKSGSDLTMADYYYVQGNFYLATNDIHPALENLEKSLGISEPMGVQVFVNRCLIALTKAEIAQVTKTKERVDPESSGRWMSKLKTHAKKMDYPGIRMQHAILQAEYQSMLNDYESARETLEAALEIYDSPSVKFLRTTIQEKIADLDKLTTAR